LGNNKENETGEQKAGQMGQEAAPKKKRIVAVFRPQNSRSGMMPRRQGQRTEGQKDRPARPASRRRPGEGQAPAAAAAERAARRPSASKPASARPSADSRSEAGTRPSAKPAPKQAPQAAAPKPRVHFRGALTGSRTAEDLLKEGAGSSIAAQQAKAQMKADERPLSESATRKPEEEARIAAENARQEAAAKAAAAKAAAEEAARKAAEAEAVKAAAEAARRAEAERAAAAEKAQQERQQRQTQEGQRSQAQSGERRERSDRGEGRRPSSQGDRGGFRRNSQTGDRTGTGNGGRSYGQGRSQSSDSRTGNNGRQGSSFARRDGSAAGGRTGDRTGTKTGGFSGVRSGGFTGRGGAAAGAGRPDAPGKSSFGRKTGDGRRTAGFGDKNSDKTRSRGRSERDKQKDKYNRFDQDDRVVTSRKKKDPNRAGAFHRPEPAAAPVEEKIKTITLPDVLTLHELADKMKMQPSALIKKLFLQGKMVTVNQELTYDEAEEIAVDYDILCEHEVKKDLIAELLQDQEDAPETLVQRPPVVCVMGHVDHGKTSLLDAIRNTHVTDREAGGITQAIGASVIDYNGRKITFLDTPGHEAFTAMRMRGANSTDIAVLVVAADDGVMPQTVEAINHAKAANIEIIVAINKIDKPSANIDRVKQELTEYGLVAEDWGGSTTMVPVSAKTHEGIDDLLEMILLTSDVLELKANPNRRARGLIIEAKLDKGRGPVASVLIQKGTLHVGDPVSAGSSFGKVRGMVDSRGREIKEVGPGFPAEIIGFSTVPQAGEILISQDSEKEAKSYAETFISVEREKMLAETKSRMSLDDLFSQIQEGSLKELNLIVKADVQGSVEALKQSLLKLSNDEVVVKIIHSGVGAINESDVTLAGASNAIIIGFNVRPDALAKSTADHEGVEIKLYKVIYDAINAIENAMTGMLEPVYEEQVTGHVEVRMIFKASGVGNIAGSYVLDGIVERGSKARITREGKQIFDGSIASLKRFKDDVKSVKAGYECGLVFDGFNEIQEGDQVEVYKMVEVPREQIQAKKEAEKKAAEKAAKKGEA